MFYPIFLALSGRKVLVVGGGPVAERKVDALLAAGASVTLVSPDATPRLRENSTEWRRRLFQESDLDGMTLVISATDNPDTQRHVAIAARARNILVNTADVQGLCDFILPAVVKRGDVIAAISTSGKSPALAAALRAQLEHLWTDDVGRAANILGAVRSEVHNRFANAADRKRIFEQVIETGILDWIGACDDEEAVKRVKALIDQMV